MTQTENHAPLLSLEHDIADFAELLGRIRNRDEEAANLLRRLLHDGVRFWVRRNFAPADLDGVTARVVEETVQCLREDPSIASLAEAVRRAARVCGLLHRAPSGRPPAGKVRALADALARCSAAERQYLERCYLHGEDPAIVREELGLTREEIAALHRRLGGPGRMALKARAASGRA